MLLLPSCGRSTTDASRSDGVRDGQIRYARNLSMEEKEDYTLVRIRNPWDTTRTLATYCLVDKSSQGLPGGLPSDAKIIRVPLEKSVVYSSVHASLIRELGAGGAVSGVCDAKFITDAALRQGLNKGLIADCGNSMQPNVERIIQTGAGAVLLSPFEGDNGSHGKLTRTGIPVIEGADYMERTPLGRAEWMKFYGRLYGKGPQADSIFAETEKTYLDLKKISENVKSRPSVIFDRIYSGKWNVPTSGSVTGCMIVDAGGSNPFAALNNAGSASLAPEEVLYKGGNADYWFVRYFGEKSFDLRMLAKDNDAYTRFKAFKNGDVYGSDTMTSGIFEDAAFHPHWILADMIAILHPGSGVKPVKRYYKKLD